MTVDEGKAAARQCSARILDSAWNAHGTLDGLRIRLVNGRSDLLHEIFGKAGDGHHARGALGLAQLPTGAAVEVEAVFEIKP